MATNALNGKPLGDGVLMAGAIGLASSVGMGAAVKLGGKALGRIAGRAVEAAESEVVGAAEEAESSVASSVEEGASCALSFAADTQVATPSGEQAIGTLHVGDHVTAYDPATSKTSTQTVQHVWINHDTDLIDVTLQVANTQVVASDAKARQAAVAAHGLRAPPVDAADAADVTAPATHDELIHTTAKHLWLTTDRGFVLAGTLHTGEQVVREDGTPATVVTVAVRPGAADYYNLTVSVLHTYAVGSGRYVVHNCGDTLRDGTEVSVTKRGLDHSFGRHAADWFGREVTESDKPAWESLIRRSMKSGKIFDSSVAGTRTKAVLARFLDSGRIRNMVVHFYQEGPYAGQLASAWEPHQNEMTGFYRVLRIL